MKNLSISFFTTFILFGVSVYSNVHAASDWTIPANPGCEVSLGNTTNVHSGYKASGGTAVIGCPLTKKVAGNNLNHVYARINRKNANGPDPFCTLNSYSLYSTSNDSKSKNASKRAGNQSLSIPFPTIYSSGYLSVFCVLNDGDTLHGIRYGQD